MTHTHTIHAKAAASHAAVGHAARTDGFGKVAGAEDLFSSLFAMLNDPAALQTGGAIPVATSPLAETPLANRADVRPDDLAALIAQMQQKAELTAPGTAMEALPADEAAATEGTATDAVQTDLLPSSYLMPYPDVVPNLALVPSPGVVRDPGVVHDPGLSTVALQPQSDFQMPVGAAPGRPPFDAGMGPSGGTSDRGQQPLPSQSGTQARFDTPPTSAAALPATAVVPAQAPAIVPAPAPALVPAPSLASNPTDAQALPQPSTKFRETLAAETPPALAAQIAAPSDEQTTALAGDASKAAGQAAVAMTAVRAGAAEQAEAALRNLRSTAKTAARDMSGEQPLSASSPSSNPQQSGTSDTTSNLFGAGSAPVVSAASERGTAPRDYATTPLKGMTAKTAEPLQDGFATPSATIAPTTADAAAPDATPIPLSATEGAVDGSGLVAADFLPVDTLHPEWEAELIDRVTSQISGEGSVIEIALSPDNLGSIDVRLEVTNGRAEVTFVTETPEAARLLIQSEAKLSDLLQRQGLDLAGQNASHRQDDRGDGRDRSGPLRQPVADADEATLAMAKPADGHLNLIA